MSTPVASNHDHTGFQQRLGLFDATMLIVGTMIGSGIFVVSAEIARDVGCSGWLMAVWVATGVMTVIGALSYAELAGMMPHAGGQYVFLREAYSPLPGFLYGWTCFLVIQTGSIAAVAVVFAKYLGEFLPEPGTNYILREWRVNWRVPLPLPWLDTPLIIFKRDTFAITAGQLVAVAVIIFLSVLNCLGVREGKWVQNIMTVTKSLALALLIVLGLTLAVDQQAIDANTAHPWEGMENSARFQNVQKQVGDEPSTEWLVMLMVAAAAMTGSMFAADAWNNITFAAGEIKNPRRTLPLSLALGTGSVIVLYLLANLAYLAVLPARGDGDLYNKIQSMEQRAASLREGAAKLARDAAKFAKNGDPVSSLAAFGLSKAVSDEADAIDSEKEALLKQSSTYQRGVAFADDDRVGTAVIEKVSPRFGVSFMAAAIMISTFGCVNGMILMGARLYYAMARDQLFFRGAGLLNSRGVPAIGLIVQGLWAIVLVFSGSYGELLDFVMFTVILFYVLTVVGMFILRFRQPNAERPYRALGYPILPGLYVLACATICVVLLIVKPENTWPGLILTLAGIPVYFFWKWRGKNQAPTPISGVEQGS